ncbi:MAG: thioredoxin family protein [Hyphomicrobium sp.]
MTVMPLFKSAVAALAMFASTSAFAFESTPFDAAAFKAAQDAGKPVVVDVFATWCGTCKAQHKVLDTLKDKPDYAKLTIFRVEFDKQADALKTFAVSKQSTLIAFNGAKETARSTGATDAAEIEKILSAAAK